MGQIICNLINESSANTKGKRVPAKIQIVRMSKSGIPEIYNYTFDKSIPRIVICEGDMVTCLQGKVYIQVNPGTQARGFRLENKPPSDGMIYDGLVITESVMRHITSRIHRGKIEVVPDIGNTSRGTGAVTR